MEFSGLVKGVLLKRYKRFLADIRLEDGSVVTAHCPNSGSMLSCLEDNAEVYCSPVNDPKRKTKFTWEMIKINGSWVGINTQHPNLLAFDWITKGLIPGFEEYSEFRREYTWDDSRFDIYCAGKSRECFVEVKNVTLNVKGQAQFPDSVTSRGRKHLQTLVKAHKAGIRSVMLYLVQRSDTKGFAPARAIDPDYADALDQARKSGVEILVVQAKVDPKGIHFAGLIKDIEDPF